MRKYLGVSLLLFLTACVSAAATVPPPAVDIPAPTTGGKQMQKAVLAGGCFWGVEGVFERIHGVQNVVSGYAGGTKNTAVYETVSTGQTGHAESVEITYDPSVISYGKLLQVFFSVAHDPTELNRQGPDEGPQYRSSIFYVNDDQKRVAEAYIAQLNAAKTFRHPVVTKVVALPAFYAAEEHHQHFLDRNPDYPYIVYNDLPKIEALKKQFPELVKRK